MNVSMPRLALAVTLSCSGLWAQSTVTSQIGGIIREAHPPHVSQLNVSIQKQIGVNWLATANYLGSRSVHIWENQELDPAVYLPSANCVIAGVTYATCSSTSDTNQRRVLYLANLNGGKYYANLNAADDGGTGSYEAMLLSLQHRMARHFTVFGNYTWFHCISGPSSISLGGSYSQPNNRAADMGNCPFDDRHLRNISSVLESPNFSTPWLRAVAGNWRLSEIIRIQAGDYISVTSGINQALTGVSGLRPNQLVSDVHPAQQTLAVWVNKSAYALPAVGSNGNAGYNILGHGTFQFDLALSRVFRIPERQALEIRGEAFNLLNHIQPLDPSIATNSPNFGQILSSRDPRIMQLAAGFVL
jgi:hypothetical protein